MPVFTHLNENNEVHMVDVTPKPDVFREATAKGRIYLRPETLAAIAGGRVLKGNVLATAQVAGTLAVKQTWALIPMCHPLPVGGVTIWFEQTDEYIEAFCRVKTYGKTGIEMEALTGVSLALLTIWDMVKSAEKDEAGQYPVTRIDGISVIEKIKGTPE
ncbi:Cyclic pyranopterin monophosphate synthase [bioreactor metagenome]|uniref:Cyclic pyranopterin monophosphate synthase n=1 Tax=bioreactor metagenome TaxID=1076179 RepID=A0A644U6H3_9ZZZZ|nr:cyclic pyranopterin monophosphate synthase MoaC [Methanocorpusculum sp.]